MAYRLDKWALNRRVTPTEMEVLVIMARSAGFSTTEFHTKSGSEMAFPTFLNMYLFYVGNPHPDAHKKRGLSLPDITYEEAIEFFKEKIKNREV